MPVATTSRSVEVDRLGAPRTPAVRFARWVGVLYASAAIVGFALTGFGDLARTSGAHLLGIEVNGLQNLLHLLVGAALVVASGTSAEAARVMTMLVAVALAVTGTFGLTVVGSDANVLALNGAANAVHLGTAAVAAVCAATTTRRHPGP